MSQDEDVGYGRPPKRTQFKPGQSGNPRGRPKGAKNLKTDLREELRAKMTIQINGTAVTASKQRLMLKTLSARAASGDIRAIKTLADLAMQIIGPEDADTAKRKLSPNDEALLAQIMEDRSDDVAGDKEADDA